MKKFFTLLLCVAGMAIAANAEEVNPVRQCIDALLSQDNNTKAVVAPTMDPNHDGVLNIHDVTFLIDQQLRNEAVQNAPAQEIDINGLIHEVLVNDGNPNIDDVTNAIDKKLNKE